MPTVIETIRNIASLCSNVNPTQLYNEGWMTRLLMRQSLLEKTVLGTFDFGKIANWESEALLSSPFVKVESGRREGYTHADIVFGDFGVKFRESGKVAVHPGAKLFGVLEAKMKSGLSKGVTRFKKFNQASRNICCIAQNTYDKDCAIFFIVVAPESRLASIRKDIEAAHLSDQIKTRFDGYHCATTAQQIISKTQQCAVLEWSYEQWIESIMDTQTRAHLQHFYELTLFWNRLAEKEPAQAASIQ